MKDSYDKALKELNEVIKNLKCSGMCKDRIIKHILRLPLDKRIEAIHNLKK